MKKIEKKFKKFKKFNYKKNVKCSELYKLRHEYINNIYEIFLDSNLGVLDIFAILETLNIIMSEHLKETLYNNKSDLKDGVEVIQSNWK